MRSKIILCSLLLLLTGCAGQSFSDIKATKNIVRQICPDIYPLTAKQQTELADLIGVCIDPQSKLDPFEKNMCEDFIAIMSQYEISRDQSRVCYNQR